MFRLILVVTICFSVNSKAQIVFQKGLIHTAGNTVGSDIRAIKKTKDGGYIFTQASCDNQLPCINLTKTDYLGNILWEKDYQTSTYCNVYSVAQTQDSSFVLCGTYWNNNSNTSDAFILKVDNNGIIKWSKSYGTQNGNEFLYQIIEKPEKGYLSVGSKAGGGVLNNAIYIISIDSLGNLLWSKTYNTNGDVCGYISSVKNGNYLLNGANDNNNIYSGFLMNFDINGNPNWIKNYHTNITGAFNNYIPTKDNGFILSGGIIDSTQDRDLYLLKIDSNYNIQWSKKYSYGKYDYLDKVIQTTDGGFIILANTLISPTNKEIVLIKTNETGQIQWSKRIGRNSEDEAILITQLSDSGYLLIGKTTDSFNTYTYPIFIKTDFQCNTCFSDTITFTDAIINSFVSSFTFNISTGSIPDTITFSEINASTFDTTLCFSYINSINLVYPKNQLFTLSPNPFNDAFTATCTNAKGNLTILEINGKVIKTISINSLNTTINLNDFVPGFYLIQYKTDNQTITQKIIKQ